MCALPWLDYSLHYSSLFYYYVYFISGLMYVALLFLLVGLRVVMFSLWYSRCYFPFELTRKVSSSMITIFVSRRLCCVSSSIVRMLYFTMLRRSGCSALTFTSVFWNVKHLGTLFWWLLIQHAPIVFINLSSFKLQPTGVRKSVSKSFF
jgi:hypothetical protein